MLRFLKVDKTKTVDINDMDKFSGEVELIDIREPFEYEFGSFEVAKNIPMGMLLSEPEKYLCKDRTYYILCQSGARSKITTGLLKKDGYDVVDVIGGIDSYKGKIK